MKKTTTDTFYMPIYVKFCTAGDVLALSSRAAVNVREIYLKTVFSFSFLFLLELLSMHGTNEGRQTLVVARTNNTFLEFCEVQSLDNVVLAHPRRRRLSSFLRRVATDPDLLDTTTEEDSQDTKRVFSVSPRVASPPPPPPPPAKRRDPQHKVFVGGLAPCTDEPTLFEFMARFGPVRSVTVKRNPVTGQSRRYAFVKFYQPPNRWIFDHPWVVDDQPIRISRYEVSADWKHHFYSDED